MNQLDKTTRRSSTSSQFLLLLGCSFIMMASSMTASPSRPLGTTTTTATQLAPPSSSSIVKNFRPAAGLPNIYRCAKTDNLASSEIIIEAPEAAAEASSPVSTSLAEQILLYEAGLVIDLRSDSERNEEKSLHWMSRAPGGPFRVVRDGLPSSSSSTTNNNVGDMQQRTVLRLDPLHPAQFMEYLDQHWLTPAQKAKAAMYKVFDGNALHRLRMQVLNQQGLFGLNQAILETGQADLCSALQAMTIHMEQQRGTNNNNGSSSSSSPIVLHCVQGKDRTGLLVMLCQSMVGASDDEIINCYHLTEKFMLSNSKSSGANKKNGDNNGEASAAAATAAAGTNTAGRDGKLDRTVFAGAPIAVMEQTLAYVRDKYKSVCPGYLNAIGFDPDWQERFRKALADASSSVPINSRL